MERVIVVLGGGGVKGLAHVGAWRALEESGLRVSEIVGTSIGALVGACIAGGMGWRDLAPLALGLRDRDIVALNRRVVLLNGIRQPSVFHGTRLQDYIRSVLPVSGFEEFSIPCSMNAVDLETGEMVWFGAGGREDVALADAIYASCALPVYFPPAEIGGRMYVDGGVQDALPIGRAAERGADLVIAIDVTAGGDRDAQETVAGGLVAMHHRVLDIAGQTRRRERLDAWDGPPLLYVRPELDGISTFDFTRTAFFLE